MNSLINAWKWLFALTISTLAPVQAVMFTVGFLIMADTFTGVWAARVRKEKVTSHGFRRVVTKMATFQIAVLSAFFIEQYIGTVSIVSPLKVVAGAIALSELASVLENVESITGIKMIKIPSIKSIIQAVKKLWKDS